MIWFTKTPHLGTDLVITKCRKCGRGMSLREILDLQFVVIDDNKWRKPRFYCKACGDREYIFTGDLNPDAGIVVHESKDMKVVVIKDESEA